MSLEKKIKYKSDDPEEISPLIRKSIFKQTMPAPLTSEEKKRNSGIYQLAKKGEIEVIDLLKRNNMNINQNLTGERNVATALHGAVIGKTKKNIELLNRLINEQDIDIDTKDDTGLAPLHYAALNRNLDAIEILINAGADYKIRGRKTNKTIFDILSIDERNKDILEKIKELVERLESMSIKKNNDISSMQLTNRKTHEVVTYKRNFNMS